MALKMFNVLERGGQVLSGLVFSQIIVGFFQIGRLGRGVVFLSRGVFELLFLGLSVQVLERRMFGIIRVSGGVFNFFVIWRLGLVRGFQGLCFFYWVIFFVFAIQFFFGKYISSFFFVRGFYCLILDNLFYFRFFSFWLEAGDKV